MDRTCRAVYRALRLTGATRFHHRVGNRLLYSSVDDSSEGLSKQFLSAMSLVPLPVVVVTTSNGTLKRGITCSSFTSISRTPPIVAFCMRQPSRMHNLLLETQKFAVHVLSENQVHHSVHFSSPIPNHQDQFDSIPYQLGDGNVPILPDCCAVLQCKTHSVQTTGDHHVWYGEVLHSTVQNEKAPLLYYARSYRSIGDEVFMSAFETATLGYEEWTHKAHLRMAWNYITMLGKEEATPLIKSGIRNYIDKNIGKVKTVYNETITLFFIHMVDEAILKFGGCPHSFEEFISSSPHLMDIQLLSRYYTPKRINSQQARDRWLEPDLQNLP